MEKILLQKQNGHAVPCIAEIPDDLKKLVIVIHGYDSSKESENAANLMRILPGRGFGVIAYDQPNHGSEEAAKEELSIEACLDSLATVEAYLAERFAVGSSPESPVPEICYFGSSFGAYILGIYLAERRSRGTSGDGSRGTSEDGGRKTTKAFMRCAAVNFPELEIDERAKALEPVNLFALFEQNKPTNALIAFAHGECDSSVPVAAAVDFAKRFGYPITVFPGEEHPICTYPESPAKVAELAIALFD